MGNRKSRSRSEPEPAPQPQPEADPAPQPEPEPVLQPEPGTGPDHVADGASSSQDEQNKYRFGKTFREIVLADTFVDKTFLISEILGKKMVLILAPRRFGKSLNLDMMKCFFEIQCDQITGEQIPRDDERNNYKLFQGLQIMQPQYAELVHHNFGKFPVLKVNLLCCDNVDNVAEAINFLKKVIHNSFMEYRYLQRSTRLPERGRALLTKWCSEDYLSLVNRQDMIMGLGLLAELLHEYFGSKLVVLIDDYDSLVVKTCLNAEVSHQACNIIMKFYDAVLSSVLSKKVLQHTVVTAVSCIITGSVIKWMCNWEPLVSSHPFVNLKEYYGFTTDEVMKLFEKFNLTEEQRCVAEEIYGGYMGYQDRVCVYHPYSLVKYISSEKRDPQSYWVNVDAVYSFKDALRDEQCRRSLCDLVDTEGEIYDRSLPMLMTHKLKSLSSHPVRPHYPEVLSLLVDQGYLTYKKRQHDARITLTIPNEEVRREFLKQLAEFYIEEYNLHDTKLNDCTNSFRNLMDYVDKAPGEFTQAFRDFHNKLQDFISDVVSDLSKVNSAILKEICFVPLFKSGIQVKYENFSGQETRAIIKCREKCVIFKVTYDEERSNLFKSLKRLCKTKMGDDSKTHILITSSVSAETKSISMLVFFKHRNPAS